MRVQVLLFARAREAYGRAETTLEIEAPATPSNCFAELCATAPRLESLRPSLLVAVNEGYAPWDRVLEEGDEVAFIPPVSGG